MWTWVRTRIDARDWALALLVGAGVLALQWPHRPLFLNIWDSFLFANAAIEYDLLGGYPHPPGYPVFVLLVKIASWGLGPEQAVETVSMLMAAFAASLMFGFLRTIVSRPAALLGAGLFSFSPTLLYNGVMSLSYTAEAAATIGVAWMAWRTRQDASRFNCMCLAFLLGVCGGLRTTVLLFLSPLALFTIWAGAEDVGTRRARLVESVAAGAVGVAVWLFPMWWFGGGARTWFLTTRLQSEVVILSNTVWTNGWAALREQTGRILVYVTPELGILLLVALTLAVATRLRTVRGTFRSALVFASIWVGPSLLFFAFVFSGWQDGPRGYALAFLPALYWLFGIGLQESVGRYLDRETGRGTRFAVVAAALLVSLSTVPASLAERETLLEGDVYERNTWGRGWLGLKDALPPDETAILASHEWEFARWYFPEYVVWGHLPGTTHPDWDWASWNFVLEARHRVDDAPLYSLYLHDQQRLAHPIPEGIDRVVLTDFRMAGEDGGKRSLLSDVEVKEMILPNGWRILYFDVDPNRTTIESYLLPLGEP